VLSAIPRSPLVDRHLLEEGEIDVSTADLESRVSDNILTGNLVALQLLLDLSNNRLSGSIPQNLAKLLSLEP
jgi:hypothetical protein